MHADVKVVSNDASLNADGQPLPVLAILFRQHAADDVVSDSAAEHIAIDGSIAWVRTKDRIFLLVGGYVRDVVRLQHIQQQQAGECQFTMGIRRRPLCGVRGAGDEQEG